MFLFDDYDLPVELILMPEEEVVVRFPNGLNGRPQWGAKFHLFEKEMKEIGFFEKNQHYLLTSHNFSKSFYEIYFRFNMNPHRFRWHKI